MELTRAGYVAIALLCILLPIMHSAVFAEGKVNLCAADAMLLPVFVLLRHRWLRCGAVGYWLFALWMVHLASWCLSLPMLESIVFVRAVFKLAACFMYALIGFAVAGEVRCQAALVRGLMISAFPIAALGICAFFLGMPQALQHTETTSNSRERTSAITLASAANPIQNANPSLRTPTSLAKNTISRIRGSLP